MPLQDTDQVYYENEDLHGNYAFTFLEELVNNFIENYTGDNTVVGNIPRRKIVGKVKQCIREFHFSVLNQVKVVELELGDSLDIILPPDFVSVVRISWLDQITGQIRPMSVNRNTTLGVSYLQDFEAYVLFDDNGDIIEGTTISEDVNDNLPIVNTDNYPNGYCRYDVDTQWNFDTSRNFNGTFNSDNSRIHFGSESAERIILLEYVSDGLAVSESEMKVHKFCEMALYAFVYNELVKSDIRVPNYEKRDIKKNYDTLVRNAKVKLLGIRPQEFLQAWKVQNTPIR